MKVPVLLADRVLRPGPLARGDRRRRSSMHSIELERISHLGAPSDEGFVVGRVVSAEQHPNADRLRVCEVDTGDGDADDRLRRAERRRRARRSPWHSRARVMPDGDEADEGEAPRGRVRTG